MEGPSETQIGIFRNNFSKKITVTNLIFWNLLKVPQTWIFLEEPKEPKMSTFLRLILKAPLEPQTRECMNIGSKTNRPTNLNFLKIYLKDQQNHDFRFL